MAENPKRVNGWVTREASMRIGPDLVNVEVEVILGPTGTYATDVFVDGERVRGTVDIGENGIMLGPLPTQDPNFGEVDRLLGNL
jgi:hypothetical protein